MMQVQYRWASALLSVAALIYVPQEFRIFVGFTLFSAVAISFMPPEVGSVVKTYASFANNCFIKPVLHQIMRTPSDAPESDDKHQNRLEEFYQGQADIYDATRQKLLHGRSTMLRLCASQLKQAYLRSVETVGKSDVIPSPPASPYLRPTLATTPTDPSLNDAKLVWVDIGGGTGWNIEHMDKYIPIEHFHAVYLVDITPSLCEVAKGRFQGAQWKNVHVLCMDALKFDLKEQLKRDNIADENVEVGLVTMSYSLSMMPAPFTIVDKVYEILAPSEGRGMLGVVDFGVSGKHPVTHDPTRHHSFLTRWFWSMWFETDNVFLNHLRREYLEHRFLTIKSLNCRNWVIRKVIGMPYYIWLGTVSEVCTSTGRVLSGATVTDNQKEEFRLDTPASRQQPISSATSELSVHHVHGQGMQWRVDFDPTPIPGLSTYIYAFAWEDPKVDLQFLDLKPDDHMLVLTSGGCNALEYAIHGPKRIHCVDMNPCQGHMLELKIAAMTALPYEDVWKLFGEGVHPEFDKILDTRLAPYLSPHAYQFWKHSVENHWRKLGVPDMKLYETGFSGFAIRVFKHMVRVKRLRQVIEDLCEASTIEKQKQIWYEQVRPHFLDRKWLRLLNNDRFIWGALGVPREQFGMLLSEGDVYNYVANTFDPVIDNHLLSRDSYFYRLCLTQRYASNEGDGCPGYLTKEGYKLLQTSHNLDAIRIHTRAIADVLRDVLPAEPTLTKVIVMDHQDWFNLEQANEEIGLLARKMKQGGRVLIRSAAKLPWYLEVYTKYGFDVRPLGIRMSQEERDSGKWEELIREWEPKGVLVHPCIDRVNMYASFWMAIKA